ncbi:pentatricopeptide repeat-containing protein At1g19720 [Rhodamnia argentea]|uniref:Pentatricopeptide repeat-containing protein At1g19720 n=1 Tax=Rhodamnia argentea TaxID=178133 RepID=A0A8B8MQH0_9MYRT|nr:pentatricopeptide repeat-containing protein At1g19720 [Rhodamnia argentea]
MENLIIPCKSRLPVVPPPSPTPQPKQDTPLEFTTRSFISLSRKTHPRMVDAHLNYLCNKGHLGEAIAVLDYVRQNGLKVRPNTYANLIESCIAEDSIHLGRKVHAMVDLVESLPLFVETKLVSMYSKCGCLKDARKVFDGMRERNLYTWSAMIGAYSREKRWREVVDMFYLMVEEGVMPDGFLFPKILQACGNAGDNRTGMLIHSIVIRSGICSYKRVRNSVLAVYAKCGELNLARRLFDSMEQKDTVTWNSLISGYCQKGEMKEAYRLFDAMQEEGTKPGLVTWNLLIVSYCQMGNCNVAMELMKKMESQGLVPDVFTWTSLISGFGQNNRRSQALDLFREMLMLGIKPNGVTLTSAISTCASLQALNRGKEVHSVAIKMGLGDNVLVGNSLIDMYSKCEEVEGARWVFDVIKDKDAYSWNSMIKGYFNAGYCGKGHELFLTMQESDVQPNVITWNVMISGYMQNGDDDQAINLFKRMEKDGKIKRNTASWNSLVAGYAQNGQKDKALGILRQMQSLHVPLNSVTVLSVLPSCANLIAINKVKEIHGCVVRRDLESVLSVANSLIDTYAKSGKIEYSRRLFDRVTLKDIITWNSMIGGYIWHGCHGSALDLYDLMRQFGLKPNRGTLVSILNAYSLAGLVEEGKQVFSSITEEHLIVPALEHYVAVVELYGHAGRLGEAVEFIENMPLVPEFSIWLALFSACRIHKNIALAVLAAERLLEFEVGSYSIYQLLLQTFGLYGKSEHSLKLKRLEKDALARKLLGESWIIRENKVYRFIADQSAPYFEHLHSWLQEIEEKVRAFESYDRLCIEEEEKEESGQIHSEKLAIAFAFAGECRTPRTIRIMKNLRMCADCHRTAKYVTLSYGCEIYLSDSKCLHHFKDGVCSCGDYW